VHWRTNVTNKQELVEAFGVFRVILDRYLKEQPDDLEGRLIEIQQEIYNLRDDIAIRKVDAESLVHFLEHDYDAATDIIDHINEALGDAVTT
jgi:hypothetical protein